MTSTMSDYIFKILITNYSFDKLYSLPYTFDFEEYVYCSIF